MNQGMYKSLKVKYLKKKNDFANFLLLWKQKKIRSQMQVTANQVQGSQVVERKGILKKKFVAIHVKGRKFTKNPQS